MKYVFFIIGLVVFVTPVSADNKNSFLDKHCGDCHDIRGPAATTLDELMQRKGPDLFYAGSKYKRDWLVSWLMRPTRIRPAGYHYFQNIKPGKKHDIIDKSNLSSHMSLSRLDAIVAADILMSFKVKPDVLPAGEFKGGAISNSFGEMVFDKFNGCSACHEIEPGYGGLSGPEMFTAARRMQEDYLVNYIRNPQSWNPKSAMPNKHVAEANIQKLVQYLVILSEEDWVEN